MSLIFVLREAAIWAYNHAGPLVVAAVTAAVTTFVTQKLNSGYRDFLSRIVDAHEKIAKLQEDLVRDESIQRKIDAFRLKCRITGDFQQGYRLTIEPSPAKIETIEYLRSDGSR